MNSTLKYLSNLPIITKDNLLGDTWVCQTLLRCISQVGKQFAFRLLGIREAVPVMEMKQWLSVEGRSRFEEEVDELLQLGILQKTGGGDDNRVLLHPKFHDHLHNSLSGHTDKLLSDQIVNEASAGVSVTGDTISIAAREKWEAILHHVVGSETTRPPPKDILKLLKDCDLLQLDMGGEDVQQITSTGFQFLLKDTHTQLWALLLRLIENTEQQSAETHLQTISFIFRITSIAPGKWFAVKDLTVAEKDLLTILAHLGVVLVKLRTLYTPTPLAATLGQQPRGTAGAGTSAHEGHLLMESNNRLYAYTSSDLEIAVISLFAQVRYRLPNMVVAQLSRQSVASAFEHGITAQQIITFLTQHAHPATRARGKLVVPPAIAQQIALWEQERSRVQMQDVVMFEDFPTQDLFRATAGYAHDMQALIWASNARQCLAVSVDAHEQIKAFITRQ